MNQLTLRIRHYAESRMQKHKWKIIVNEVTKLKRWEVNSLSCCYQRKWNFLKKVMCRCICSLRGQKVKINQKEFPCKTRRGWWFRHGYESLEKCACFFGLCALQTISSYFFKHISWLNDLENVGISLMFTHYFTPLYQFDEFSHIYITHSYV